MGGSTTIHPRVDDGLGGGLRRSVVVLKFSKANEDFRRFAVFWYILTVGEE